MTDKEIYELLIRIDNGYIPSYKEQIELENVMNAEGITIQSII
jgi:hypothetical protein